MKTNLADNLSIVHKIGMTALAAVLVAALAGCAAVIVGAGAGATVAYKMGQMEATAPAGLSATAKATNDAFAQLQLALVSKKEDAFGAEFIGRTAMDKKVLVQLSGAGDKATQVKIRIGYFGDEPMSLKIYEQIKAGLAP
jgi:hypothetical protein